MKTSLTPVQFSRLVTQAILFKAQRQYQAAQNVIDYALTREPYHARLLQLRDQLKALQPALTDQ